MESKKFYQKKSFFYLTKLYPKSRIKGKIIKDIKPLFSATKNDISFFDQLNINLKL